MTFQKGQSGNPAGRPPNASDKRNQVRDILQSRAPEIVNKAVEMALDGDPHALRICMDRIMPKLTGHHVKVDLPVDGLDRPEFLLGVGTEIIKNVLSGNITPEQAKDLTTILESQRKMTETVELKTLLNTLKEKINDK